MRYLPRSAIFLDSFPIDISLYLENADNFKCYYATAPALLDSAGLGPSLKKTFPETLTRGTGGTGSRGESPIRYIIRGFIILGCHMDIGRPPLP